MNNQYASDSGQVNYRLGPECKGLEGHAKEFGLYLISNREPLKVSGRGQT